LKGTKATNDIGRTRTRLVVLSITISGDEIAKRLGVQGDRQWDAGDPVRPGSKTRQKFAGWEVESRLERSLGAAAHLSDLLERIADLNVAINLIATSGDIESARVWLHLDSPSVGFSLEPDTMRQLAEFGSLEVDIYG
jgi:hypothetical protein